MGRLPQRTPPRRKKTQHNLTAGEWKAGTSARSRRVFGGFSSAWLYVHEEDSLGNNRAKHLPYTHDDAILMAAAKDMYKRLLEARDAIASLPADALGTAHDPPDGFWPVRDELIHHITRALPKFQEDEEPEENEMVKTLILLDESFKDDQSKLLLSRSAEDPILVEIDVDGDTTVSLTYKELQEALAFLKGDAVIR